MLPSEPAAIYIFVGYITKCNIIVLGDQECLLILLCLNENKKVRSIYISEHLNLVLNEII